MPEVRLAQALLLGSLCLIAAPVHADGDPRPRARELAQRGIELSAKGRHGEAFELLEQAERLFHAPAHLLCPERNSPPCRRANHHTAVSGASMADHGRWRTMETRRPSKSCWASG